MVVIESDQATSLMTYAQSEGNAEMAYPGGSCPFYNSRSLGDAATLKDAALLAKDRPCG